MIPHGKQETGDGEQNDFERNGVVWPRAVAALADEVKRRGYGKALIVTDKTLVQCGAVSRVTDSMDAAGLAWRSFPG